MGGFEVRLDNGKELSTLRHQDCCLCVCGVYVCLPVSVFAYVHVGFIHICIHVCQGLHWLSSSVTVAFTVLELLTPPGLAFYVDARIQLYLAQLI